MAEYIYTRTLITSGEYDINTSYGPSRLLNDIYVALPFLQNVKIISDGLSTKVITQVVLSSSDIVILNSAVATHKSNNVNTSVPTPYMLTGLYESPTGLNINLFGLFRKDFFNNRGELIIKEYYNTYDGVTYSNLVVKDEYLYTTNAVTDLVTYRDETLTWYLQDGSVGTTKVIRKYYDLIKAIKEGVRRRQNLLDQAKAYGLATIVGTHVSGLPNSYYWFSTMSAVTDTYLNGTIRSQIIDFINNSTEPYVTQTIKDAMVAIFDYWT